jgi:hypothetical protein
VDQNGSATDGATDDDDLLALLAQALVPPTPSPAEVNAAGRAVYRLRRSHAAAATSDDVGGASADCGTHLHDGRRSRAPDTGITV